MTKCVVLINVPVRIEVDADTGDEAIDKAFNELDNLEFWSDTPDVFDIGNAKYVSVCTSDELAHSTFRDADA